MFFEFFVFWGVWWWILFGALIVVDVLCLENDNGVGATISLIVFGAAMFFFGDWNPFPWMAANSLWTITIILGYFMAGSLWSIAKWYFYCLNVRDEYNEIKNKFFELHDIKSDKIPVQLKRTWEDQFKYSNKFSKEIPPKAIKHKGTIITWMTHWPFSALWTLLNEPIRRIFMSIYSHLAGLLQRISNRLFSTAIVTFEDD